MYVDPSKPLPIPSEKKDYLGSVLDGMLRLHFSRLEHQGAADDTFQQKVDQVTTQAQVKIDKLSTDITAALATHVAKKGSVHGETKVTVGLGNKDNWRMATDAEHVLGTSKVLYAHPHGLKALVEDRLTIDPSKYIRARIIPIASGGQLGTTIQWFYNWSEREVVQSFDDPMNYFTDTPWQFKSDSGVFILPSMNGSDVLTQVIPDAGRGKRAKLPFGGLNVRVYNKALDVRRSRPGFLRAESSLEPNNELLVGSSHLFDKHAAFYVEPSSVGIRGFNRYRLPFETLSNLGKWNNNWKGIVEVRENFLYNLRSSVENANLGGNGQDLYWVLRVNPYTFIEGGYNRINGPGSIAEVTANIGDAYTTTFTVPAGNKIKILTESGKVTGIYMKLRDILTYTDAQLTTLNTTFNKVLAGKIAFAWRNRLRGEMVMRIPLGFYSADKKFYTNYYLDLDLLVTENTTTKAVAINVTSLRDLASGVQTLNANLQVSATGRFVQAPASVKDDIFHPLVFNGVFDSLGGHIKTYTLYNRQYVGYYQHEVGSVNDWLLKGDAVRPTLTKYQYSQNSTLNQDGMYGDHLRHIPLAVKGSTTDYLVQSRDWRNQYRWAIVNVETDNISQLISPDGSHYGPWRNSVAWLNPVSNTVPSFMIVNDEDSTVFDTSCLVFNNQNSFKGYARYGYDSSNADVPLTWLDPVSLDDTILNWVAVNGGGWIRNQRQFFFYKNVIYWFSQTLDNKERKADGTDCYYGYIKNAYIDVQGDVRVIKTTGPITLNVTATAVTMTVNSVASLEVDNKNVTGWDEYTATDVYCMAMDTTGNDKRYELMVNLGPFNNFYFEFETVINQVDNTVTFAPNSKSLNPVFPFAGTGFNVDYDALTMVGTKTPHQFHINYQSPVMLKKAMLSLRKTPGLFANTSKSGGIVIVEEGLFSNVAGVPIFPVGSVITAGGSNVMAKSPISAKGTLFTSKDELFVKLNETPGLSAAVPSEGAVVYGTKYNPNGYETEPNSGIVPAGFIKEGVYYHYDPDGYRNDLLPVIDGKRMSFYGYGSSFPALMGVYGSGTPINHFFLTDKATIIAWDTTKSRAVFISAGSPIEIRINNVVQSYTGGGTFTIPTSITGTPDIYIKGITTVKWATGFTELKQIGTSVTKLDFSGSDTFNISALLPKRITSFDGLFSNAKGVTYPGLGNWDVSSVITFNNTFADAVNFNQDLSNWNTTSATIMSGMFTRAANFNQPIGKWNTRNVTTMMGMFLNATAFNQDISLWVTSLVTDFTWMFFGASSFNANISNWDTRSGTKFESMFENATSFETDIGRWSMSNAQVASRMFAGATLFNGNIGNWDVSGIRNFTGMFRAASNFDRDIGSWDVGNATVMFEMFYGATKFGADGDISLSDWDVSSVVDFRSMFKQCGFNGPIEGWIPGGSAVMDEMFWSTQNFNQDISTWDFSQVSSVTRMFAYSTGLQIDLKGLDLSKCTSLQGMFMNSTFPGDVSDWILGGVGAGVNASMMFRNTPFFTGEGLETWEVSGITNMSFMFENAAAFNGNVDSWLVLDATNFDSMFKDTPFFNRDLGAWVPDSAINYNRMFNNATIFNQDLSSWRVQAGVSHVDFDTGATAWAKARPNFTS